MRKAMLIILAIVLGGGAGYGLAVLASNRISQSNAQPAIINGPETTPDGRPYGSQGWREFYRRGMGGMMWPYYNQNQDQTGPRLSLDQAVEKVTAAVNRMGSDLQVTEVMEFQNNFYAAVIEKSTGRGAFELLVDPYSGAVSYEPGPNMMWNLKYGHMNNGLTLMQENPITLAQAKGLAQKALDSEVRGAVVESTGIDFYGYYTFDYRQNGSIAGMLSVNGITGQVWLHPWHGTFVNEKEISQ